MKTLILKTKDYSLYKVDVSLHSTTMYDSLELSLDSAIWVYPELSRSSQIIVVDGKPRILINDIHLYFNNRASSVYNISDSKDIIEEWSQAIEFVEQVRKYMSDNDWLVK